MKFNLSVEFPNGNLIEEMAKRSQDLRPAWPKAAETVKAAVDQNFTNQGPPEGEPWPPSLRALRDGGLTLVDTGRLRDSATDTLDGAAQSARIGSSVPYAKDVTTGKGIIPPRPFLEIGQAAAETVAAAILDYIVRGKV